jgi:hypothetical protein
MKNPLYTKPLPQAAERDAMLVAEVWRERGTTAANVALDMVAWLSDAVRWEMVVIADRARYLMRQS